MNWIRELARKWLSLEIQTFQDAFEDIVLEQFVTTIPEAIYYWIVEHKLDSCNLVKGISVGLSVGPTQAKL